jgi:hypothetical protein
MPFPYSLTVAGAVPGLFSSKHILRRKCTGFPFHLQCESTIETKSKFEICIPSRWDKSNLNRKISPNFRFRDRKSVRWNAEKISQKILAVRN